MSTLTKNKKPNAFVRLTKHSEFTIGLVVIALFPEEKNVKEETAEYIIPKKKKSKQRGR